MSFYSVPIKGYIVIEAENAVQAAKHAQAYRLIGSAVGFSKKPKDRDFVRYERGPSILEIGKPVKIVALDGGAKREGK